MLKSLKSKLAFGVFITSSVVVACDDTHPSMLVAVTIYVYVPVVNPEAGKVMFGWF